MRRDRHWDFDSYLAGYDAALRELRLLLSESRKPPIVVLCGVLDDKIAKMRREKRALDQVRDRKRSGGRQ